jgi:hypothetical protein
MTRRPIGGATGTVWVSPARAKRMAAQRRRQERSWAAKSGPVTVRYADVELVPDESAPVNL